MKYLKVNHIGTYDIDNNLRSMHRFNKNCQIWNICDNSRIWGYL